MSSRNIQKEIVQMVFDAKQFRKGIRSSISDLADFKKSFDLGNAEQSLSSLEEASKINFAPMAKSLESLNSKISLVGVAAATMVSNLTTSIISGAKKMFDALVLTPIKTGLEEYETQLNAVQTILANTAKDGTNLEDVTDALNELNQYADLTIYNFTQMTKSIGTFTTAGVDLETSVSAIKGIANIAALSGSSALQASTAMYQLSQALSSGTVRLQDWISVENAGMGGTIFRDSLMDTARVHGVAVDQMVEQSGSFRASLTENAWLSSEILLETLEKFTGDLTEAELRSLGYTKEQIEGIIETARLASDAATKVKTLTQLKETMDEVMQSGWAQTWAIIFGDFEEAKVLWGNLSTIFGDLIANSAQARNKMLQVWKDIGGRTSVIKGFLNIIDAVVNVLGAFGEAFRDIFPPMAYTDLFRITFAFMNFSKTLLLASENTEGFKSIVRGFAAGLDIIRMVIVAILEPLIGLVKQLSPAAGSFLETAVNVADAVVAFREFAIETDFFRNIVANIVTYLSDMIERLAMLKESFLELEIIEDISEWVASFEKNDFVNAWNGFLTVVQAIITPFILLALSVKALYLGLIKLEIVKQIGEYFQIVNWENIKDAFRGISVALGELVDRVKGSDLLGKISEYFNTFDGRRMTQFLEDAKEGFSWLTDILAKLTPQMGDLETKTANVGEGLGGVGKAIAEALTTAMDYLIEKAKTIDYSAIFKIINTGLLAGLALSLKNLASGGLLQGLIGEDLTEGIGDIFESMEGTLTSFQNNIKADTLQKIAISIALLAGSLVLLTLIDSTKLLAASGAIALMIGMLFGSAGALKVINSADVLKASVAIVGLSVALGFISIALRNVSNLNPEELQGSLAAMAAGLTALVLSVNALSTKGDKGLLKTVGLMLGLGLALKILTGTIQKFGDMDPDIFAQGLTGIAAALGILVTSMMLLAKVGEKNILTAAIAVEGMAVALVILAFSINKFGEMDPETLAQGLETTGIILAGFGVFSRLLDPKGMIGAAIGITIISASLIIMAEAVKRFGKMDYEEMERGLAGIAVAMLILVVAANAMSGTLLGAAAMLVMSVAILALSAALKVMSSMSWGELLIALTGLAATFLIIGLAGLLLTPVIPLLLLLGAAMLLIGAGAALMGTGLMYGALGLVAIAGSAAAIGIAIGIVGAAIVEVLPKIGSAIAEALANFLQTIADRTPGIIESMNKIILGMIQGVATLIPDIVETVMVMLDEMLSAIMERLPDVIQTGYDILLAFLKGVADNIGEVVTTTLTIITEMLTAIAGELPAMLQAGYDILLAFLDGILDNIADIVTTSLRIVTEMLTAIASELPAMLQAGYDILLAFLDGIKDNIADIIATGLQITAEVINGIADGIPDLIDSAFNLILEFLDAIADAIEEYMPQILKAGKRIGEALIDALVGEIGSGISEITAAIGRVAAAALDALKKSFFSWQPGAPAAPDPAGPSGDPGPDPDPDPPPEEDDDEEEEEEYDDPRKEKPIPFAFVDTIKETTEMAEKELGELAKKLQEAEDPLFDALADGLQDAMVLAPVIKPILDLDDVKDGFNSLGTALDNSVVLAQIAADGEEADVLKGSVSTAGDKVTLIQNNYSPKALDAATIYRQTKTQVAQLAVRAETS